MLKLTVSFTVILVVSIFRNKVEGAPANDIQNLLQSLQQQIEQEQNHYRPRKNELNDDNNQDSQYGSLKSLDLARLFSQNSNRNKNRDYSYQGPEVQSYRDLEEYLLSRRPLPEERAVPDNLIGATGAFTDLEGRTVEEASKEDNNPFGYSKVYVVLNSDAIKQSRNKDKLNALLSSLLSPPPSRDRRDRRGQKRGRVYKGFHVYNDSMRRINRDSSEIYAKDPVLDKERPIRMREPRGSGRGRDRGRGGGGSNNGRTAIPYIRQRGDIYERED